jgi:hypothetical protein
MGLHANSSLSIPNSWGEIQIIVELQIQNYARDSSCQCVSR